MAQGTQIGVFFDGTGNCKDNDVDKGCETNVVKLYELYKTADTEHLIHNQKFYRRGVGSELGEFVIGTFSGIGGLLRIELMLADVQEHLNRPEVRDLTPKIIDVCGFSRGASQARHFVNCIKYEKIIDERTGTPFEDIRIRFLGLFDTVASFGIPGNSLDPGFDLHIDKNFVGKTVHFTAEHEKRSLFDLKSIKTTPNEQLNKEKMEEKSFPGAHSDVGGGYAHQDAKPARTIRRVKTTIRIPALPEKRNELSRIPLREMHAQMVKAGVPLDLLDSHPRPACVAVSPELEQFYTANVQGTAFDEIIKCKYVHDSRYFFDSMRMKTFDSQDERDVDYPKANPRFWKDRESAEQDVDVEAEEAVF